ncbi:MAG TPA: NAD(P)/FAD-dependent oxidoreductase, partial [Candidatus Ozemobacteraceae bacterium]|nr:NAD(P)/FAD-dependent oxidoreductase [Candidatus Ozemobacteraceae bacterium]
YASEHAQLRIGELVATLVPAPLSRELCLLAGIDPFLAPCRVPPSLRDRLIKLLAWTPLTVTGHGGFEQAMATRGGVSLKEIRPETLESRLVKGLFFCGEVLNLDGPCGGFNLQWAFSSGFLAGHLGGSSPE